MGRKGINVCIEVSLLYKLSLPLSRPDLNLYGSSPRPRTDRFPKSPRSFDTQCPPNFSSPIRLFTLTDPRNPGLVLVEINLE